MKSFLRNTSIRPISLARIVESVEERLKDFLRVVHNNGFFNHLFFLYHFFDNFFFFWQRWRCRNRSKTTTESFEESTAFHNCLLIKRAALSRCLGLEGGGNGRNSGAKVFCYALEDFIPGKKSLLPVDLHAFVPFRSIILKSPAKIAHQG